MSRAISTTLLMGVVAGVLSAIAAFCYPWPRPIETAQQVNQRLFAEIDTQQTRNITLLQFDRDEKRLDRIELKQQGDQWVIPSANNYPAGNSRLIAAIKDAVGEAVVLEVESDEEGSHQLFGVVDPETVADATQTGIGSKIILADTNDRPIASLIVGEQVGDEPNQRFVRIAEQPGVYIIAFNASLLSTTLSDWADHNLLSLKTTETGPGFDISGLTVEHYTVDADQIMTDQYDRRDKHQTRISRVAGTWQVAEFARAEEGAELQPVAAPMDPSQPALSQLITTLIQIPFQNVIRKPREAIAALTAEGGESQAFTQISNYGFKRAAGQPIDSTNGALVVSTPSGVDFRLSFGRLVEMAPASGSPLNYFMIITATTNEAAFEIPAEPADDSEAEKDRYDRAMKRRADDIAAAARITQQYNARFADWIYLVSENVLQSLRPDHEQLLVPKKENE